MRTPCNAPHSPNPRGLQGLGASGGRKEAAAADP